MKVLCVILIIVSLFFFVSGVKMFKGNISLGPQKAGSAKKVVQLESQLGFLDKFPSQPATSIKQNYIELKDFIRKYANLYGVEQSVKIHRQQDYSRDSEYITDAKMPSVKKLDVHINLKSSGGYWKLARVLNEAFKKFPLEFNSVVYTDEKRKVRRGKCFRMYSVQGNKIILDCVITLYGV